MDHFARDVLYLDVRLSPAARAGLDGLLAALRTLPWMSWDARDAEGWRPHVTVAEECGARFDEARAFVAAHARSLDARLDNAAIYRNDGAADGPTRPVLVGRVALG